MDLSLSPDEILFRDEVKNLIAAAFPPPERYDGGPAHERRWHAALLERGEKMQLTYTVRNTARAIGARTSSHIVRKYGMTGLAPGHLTVQLRGSAGQSLGAFAVQGLRIELTGEANDYVGKGLPGATIVVRPSPHLAAPEANALIGNTVLYGATSGRLFAAGRAGERFAVRNSGATTVIEGCGDHGCEYMTNGTVAILGKTGKNFGAGMSGGTAYVFDLERDQVNRDSLASGELTLSELDSADAEIVRDLLERHVVEADPAGVLVVDPGQRRRIRHGSVGRVGHRAVAVGRRRRAARGHAHAHEDGRRRHPRPSRRRALPRRVSRGS